MSQSHVLARQIGMNAELDSPADVVIVGGGLAGLTAAATIARSGKRAVVLERQSAPGGDARSSKHHDFTFNRGPHALYRGGAGHRILAELGVKIGGGVPPVKGRIVFGEESHVAPAGPLTLLRTRGFGAKDKMEIAKVLGAVPKMRPERFAEVTVSQWVDGLVSGERPRQLLHLLSRLATYGNQPEEMSAEVAAGQLQLALGPGVLYLHGGWQTLVDQLAATPGVDVRAGHAVAELPDAPAVIIAAGGPAVAGRLLGMGFNVGPAAEVSCLDLGLRRAPEHDVVLGADPAMYFSNHSAVAELAPPGSFCASALQYLGADDEPDHRSIREFVGHAGVSEDDIVFERKLHRMTACSALATAERGGLAGRPGVADSGVPNVFIAGDWVGDEGHLVDASIASGEKAAVAALRAVDRATA